MEKSPDQTEKQKFNFKTRKELAEQLGLHENTLRRMLKRRGFTLPPGRISPEHYQLILEKLGCQ